MLYVQASDILVASTRLNLMAAHPLAEIAPSFGIVQAGFNLSALGAQIDIYSGTNLISQRLIPLIKATMPIFPEDFLVQFAIAPGERITFDLLETAAATPTLLWAMRFIPA